jgi:hypothetical protein
LEYIKNAYQVIKNIEFRKNFSDWGTRKNKKWADIILDAFMMIDKLQTH